MSLNMTKGYLRDFGAFDPLDIDFGPIVWPGGGGGPAEISPAGWDSLTWGQVACVYTKTIAPPSIDDLALGSVRVN